MLPKLAFTSAISICNMSLSLERRNSQRLWDLPSDLTVLLGTECTVHYHRFPYHHYQTLLPYWATEGRTYISVFPPREVFSFFLPALMNNTDKEPQQNNLHTL